MKHPKSQHSAQQFVRVLTAGVLTIAACNTLAAEPLKKPAAAECKKLAPSAKDIGGDTNFSRAVASQKIDLVKKMLACGANVNLKTDEGWYPIHTAAYDGTAELIDLLAKQGANINAKGDFQGWTPLHMAVEGRNLDGVKTLLALGAKRDIKDASGKTAYENATSSSDRKDIAELLK
ncbi:ankyrin repeat domain-containing protein [Variovorax guangxiensis]|uniref:Ankyrin repeat domain-containing protein n=1 Tax=Variovorax guangxiensis TaxID=1775474 RepID=A0A3S0Z8L6_9BURK|nr:ankyrin repeat domain-containing protein [Variovorax guangxiensis]RUR71143.1 ankyrin repeat domain-containing protein [Variovorax guangxiensis]